MCLFDGRHLLVAGSWQEISWTLLKGLDNCRNSRYLSGLKAQDTHLKTPPEMELCHVVLLLPEINLPHTIPAGTVVVSSMSGTCFQNVYKVSKAYWPISSFTSMSLRLFFENAQINCQSQMSWLAMWLRSGLGTCFQDVYKVWQGLPMRQVVTVHDC